MGRIFKILLRLLAPTIMCAATTASMSAELPRMWLASKPGQERNINLLGITHVGVESEYDGYLDRKILPAARQARQFYLEGVSEAREIRREPACVQGWTDPAAAATEAQARATLSALEFESLRSMRDSGTAFLKAPDVQLRAMARSDAEDLSELGLMGAFRIYGRAQDISGSGARGSVAAALLKLFDTDQVHDIDEPGAFAKAYCDMGPSRIKYFYEQTLGRGVADTPKSTSELSNTVARLNQDFIETIRRRKAIGILSSPPEWDLPVICERNAQWVRKLDSQPTGSNLFVAIGVAHLFAIDNAGTPCKGLLQDLVDQGYSVHLVE